MKTNERIVFCLLLSLILAGCKPAKESVVSRSRKASGAAASEQYRDELLTYAVDNLHRLEEFDSPELLQQVLQRLNEEQQKKSSKDQPADTLLAAWPEPEMLRQIVDRLNQWARGQQPLADWRADPMLSTLPQPLADLPLVKSVDKLEFHRFDGYVLQEAAWLHNITTWARGDALDDLERAKSLFDWTIRNIQLERDDSRAIPLFPWESLLFGHGTSADRAWVFVLLARQLGIDAAVLAIDDKPKTAEKSPEKQATSKNTPEAKKVADSLPPGSTSTHSPRLWCVAVLIEGHAYLFDPLQGLPIPAPNGVKLDETGSLTIQPATLQQVASDGKLLRQMDADDTHVYGVKAEDLKHLVVLLEASPCYLSQRMKLLESRLAGQQKMALTVSPSAQAEHWKSVAHVGKTQLWLRPFETMLRRSHLAPEEVQARLMAMLPFYGMASAPLRRGRVLYFKGKFVGDDSATSFFQQARPSNAELAASSSHPMEKLIYLRGKQDASYWLGLISYQRANYPTAIDYFTTRTLLATPNGPWSNGARYNLARTFEAQGDRERAILQYAGDTNSLDYLGRLLRAKWLKQSGDGTSQKK